MNQQPVFSIRRRIRDTVAVAVVIAGLASGWSCQPAPAPPDVRIALVRWAWLEDIEAILLVTSVEEADPFRTYGRLELSWLDNESHEIYRVLYNTSSRANPVPPECLTSRTVQWRVLGSKATWRSPSHASPF